MSPRSRRLNAALAFALCSWPQPCRGPPTAKAAVAAATGRRSWRWNLRLEFGIRHQRESLSGQRWVWLWIWEWLRARWFWIPAMDRLPGGPASGATPSVPHIALPHFRWGANHRE